MAERNSFNSAGSIGNGNISELFEQLHNEALQRNDEAVKHWTKLRDEYTSLHGHLAVLPDSLSQQVMVPIGSKALMRGLMVHTNEILVCLGDGWFVKRSAKQAAEICNRRIKVCEDFLAAVEKEHQLLSSRKNLPVQQDVFSSGEIVEEYDEAREAQWRVEHREKEKAYRRKLSEERKKGHGCETEEDVWKRFEELELKEELSRLSPEFEKTEGQEVEEQQYENVIDEVEDDDDDDDELTDELSDEFELVLPGMPEDTGVRGGNGLIRNKLIMVAEENRSSTDSGSVPLQNAQRLENRLSLNSSSTTEDQGAGDGPPVGRRVSFAGLDIDADSDSSDEPVRIEFKHSPCGGSYSQEDTSLVQTPADIYTKFKIQCPQKGPKSILKKKHNETRNVEMPQEEANEYPPTIFPQVFGEVLEHPSPESPTQPEAPELPRSRPMSRFREARQRAKR